jgi:uncharacterized protein (TIGR04222 family)
MAYVLAGALMVAAVAVLTLPWSRRDPADFTRPELGYAWRGPRGAVRATLGVLHNRELVSVRRGKVTRRDKKVPRGTDPFVRAVFDGLGPTADDVSTLIETPVVQEHLPPVADRAIGARLRVGAPRRAAGLALTFASPVIVLVALAHGKGPVVAGVLTGLAAVVVAAWLAGLHGMTIAGARTLAAAPGRRSRHGNGTRAGLADMSAGSGWVFGATAFETPGGGLGDSGMGDSGGDDGGSY